jgi:hypothetical protein
MRRHDPTPAPPGRLARLGVVLDLDEPVDRVRGLAILCDRAGIDAVWLAARAGIDDPARWVDPTTAAVVVATALQRARLGMMLPLDAASSGIAPGGPYAPAAAQELALAAAVIPGAVQAGAVAIDDGPRPRISAVLDDIGQLAQLIDVVDDVVLPGWRFADLETVADEVRAEVAEAGRDPATLGVAALVTVSIGRTEAEARARADADAVFAQLGHPAEHGIFGTLEECQDRVIALAHAGITDLRCVLPASLDLHDVIAQLTAVTIGTVDVLLPGALRSPAPAPPDGWGGRADVPPSVGVSGGSKRR